MEWLPENLLGNALLLVVGIAALFFAKLMYRLCTRFAVEAELSHRDNPAVALSYSGYLLGVVAVFAGALAGPSKGLATDLAMVSGYTVGGILLLHLSQILNDRLALRKFSNRKEIIEDANAGTGAVEFGAYLASGLMVAGAVNGEGGGPLTALAFFALGQIVLLLAFLIYEKVTPYDLHAEIEKDNVAAGVACAGNFLALGIVLFHANAGAFTTWGEALQGWAVEVGLVLLALPILRVLIDRLLLPGFSVSKEIQEDGNVGVALLEATLMTGAAFVLVSLFL